MTEITTREEWTDAEGTHHVTYRDTVGRLHRKDGPAHSATRPNGYRHEAWLLHGKRHRKGGPAVTTTDRDGSQLAEWWEDGVFIREERIPAPDRGDGLRTAVIDEARAVRESIERMQRRGRMTREEIERIAEQAQIGMQVVWTFSHDELHDPWTLRKSVGVPPEVTVLGHTVQSERDDIKAAMLTRIRRERETHARQTPQALQR